MTDKPTVKCFIELSMDLESWPDFRDRWDDYVQQLIEYAYIDRAEMVLPAIDNSTVIELPRF